MAPQKVYEGSEAYLSTFKSLILSICYQYGNIIDNILENFEPKEIKFKDTTILIAESKKLSLTLFCRCYSGKFFLQLLFINELKLQWEIENTNDIYRQHCTCDFWRKESTETVRHCHEEFDFKTDQPFERLNLVSNIREEDMQSLKVVDQRCHSSFRKKVSAYFKRL